ELFAILARCTSSTTGWYLLWDGYGQLDTTDIPWDSRVNFGGMDYLVMRGPLDAPYDFPDGPNWWWPDDRAWCYQLGIDNHDTNFAYLGASRRCIHEIFQNPLIEALVARSDDPAYLGMDTTNPHSSLG